MKPVRRWKRKARAEAHLIERSRHQPALGASAVRASLRNQNNRSFDARISMRAIPRSTGSEEGPSLLPDWATEAVVGPVAVFAAAAEAEFDAAGADVRATSTVWPSFTPYCCRVAPPSGFTVSTLPMKIIRTVSEGQLILSAMASRSCPVSAPTPGTVTTNVPALPVWPFTVILMGGPSTGG